MKKMMIRMKIYSFMIYFCITVLTAETADLFVSIVLQSITKISFNFLYVKCREADLEFF